MRCLVPHLEREKASRRSPATLEYTLIANASALLTKQPKHRCTHAAELLSCTQANLSLKLTLETAQVPRRNDPCGHASRTSPSTTKPCQPQPGPDRFIEGVSVRSDRPVPRGVQRPGPGASDSGTPRSLNQTTTRWPQPFGHRK